MFAGILLIGYFLILLLLIVKMQILKYKLLSHAKKNAPDLYAAYQASQYFSHPWTLFAKKVRSIAKGEGAYDSIIVDLAKKGIWSERFLLYLFFISPIVAMLIFIINQFIEVS
jgi:uncharacterized membrane protein